MGSEDASEDVSSIRRQELGLFLRKMRERLDPLEAAGPVNPRRRAKGWLREEVAQAAGISSTWYMWLEQGRAVRASPRALNGLARALRLDGTKRAYMFRLARPDLAAKDDVNESDGASDALIAAVNALSPHPAYVLNQRWDVIAYNVEADFLLGGFDLADQWSYNLIARLFLAPDMRQLMQNWETLAASAVGQFRSTTTELTDDPDHMALVESLMEASPEFRNFWSERTIAGAPNWRKEFHHPVAGKVAFHYMTMRPMGVDEAFRLTIYTPATPESANQFAKTLSKAGIQPANGQCCEAEALNVPARDEMKPAKT